MLGTLIQSQMEDLLRAQVVGRIGCQKDGLVYVVPVTYMYDGTSIIGHTSAGLKIDMMRQNPAVCFEVDRMDNLANWESVILWGTFEELTGAEAEHAMQQLLHRLMPEMAVESAQPSHGLHPAAGHRADTAGREAIVYRIRVDQMTGRFEKR